MTVSQTQTTTRLTRDHWIDAATATLVTQGIDGVRVEKLAKDLSVTKGSFYWHFKDRDDLCNAVLEKWRRQNTVDMIEFLGSLQDAPTRLKMLVRLPFKLDTRTYWNRMSLSMRLWARHDDNVRKVLAEIDDLRVRVFAKLFVACGFLEPEARARAVLLYSYLRVALELVDRDDHELRARCEQLLMPPASQDAALPQG